jgi:hypothetical protein
MPVVQRTVKSDWISTYRVYSSPDTFEIVGTAMVLNFGDLVDVLEQHPVSYQFNKLVKIRAYLPNGFDRECYISEYDLVEFL